MDPITALGLGANILQIIDVGVRVVQQTKEVLDSGAVPDHEYHKAIAHDLKAVVASLSEQNASNAMLENEQGASLALWQLVKQCQGDAEAVIARIPDRDPADEAGTGFIRKFSAFRRVAKAYWTRPEIEALEKRLTGYRAQLSIRMLAALNEKIDNQGNDIVEVLSLARAFESSIKAVSAVLTKRDRSLQTILDDSPTSQSGDVPYSISYRAVQRLAGADIGKEPTSDSLTTIPASFTEVEFQDVAQKILDTLWFRLVPSRERGIDEAFDETFEWIFASGTSATTTWSHFPTWLRQGQGCYWINGKAGSGKSTLMKFIGKHSGLRSNLKTWAGQSDLLIGTFFFWRAGQDVQKSQEGLLRSLLFQLLDTRRELLTVCFPELCNTLSERERYLRDLSISFDDLRTAFTRLIKHQIPNTKIFLLIDGLDEYQGDYRSLSDLVLQASKSNTIKILVSSRPLPRLVQAFSNFDSLKVQDLTIDDITRYATGSLVSDPALRHLNVLHPGFSQQLIDNIVSKASGVFLWVVLVCRKVLEGLANYDSKDDLLLALEGLPVDLEQLYAHMFSTVTDAYREEASLAIQLYVRSEAVQFHYPMTALQLSYAENQGTEDCFDDKLGTLTPNELVAVCDRIEGRLRSRCCGLLEIQKSTWGVKDSKIYIGFLHRTVLDFFEREEIWTRVTSWRPVAQSQLDHILLCSCIREFKQDLPIMDAQPSRNSRIIPDYWTRLLHGFAYCGLLRSNSTIPMDPYISELWKLYQLQPYHRIRRAIDKWAVSKTHDKSLDISTTGFCQPILMFAAAYGLGESSELLRRNLCNDRPQCCSLMLLNLMLNLDDPPDHISVEKLAEGVLSLLKHDIDPNAPGLYYPPIDTAGAPEKIKYAVRLSPNQHNDLIPWIFWLSAKRQNLQIVLRHPLLYMQILERLLSIGAMVLGRLGGVRGQKHDTIVNAVEDCFTLLPLSGSAEATELRRRIQAHLRQSGAALSRTKSEQSSSLGSVWRSRFKSSKRNTLGP